MTRSQLDAARHRGDVAAIRRLTQRRTRQDRIADAAAVAVGVLAAVIVVVLVLLLMTNAALGVTPSPAVGQLAAWNADTAPLVSVPSPVQEATPVHSGVLDGGGGGRVPGDVRSTGSAPAPGSPSVPPPPSGPDDGENGGGDAPSREAGVQPDPERRIGEEVPSPSPPLDEIWTCGDVTAGVATWLNAHTTYTDLTSDPACSRGGPDRRVPGESGTRSGPPPTTTTPPYEGPVVLCEHPDIGSGSHRGSTCPAGWSLLGEPTVRTTTTTTVYVGPVVYCSHPQFGSGGFRGQCPEGWTEMTS